MKTRRSPTGPIKCHDASQKQKNAERALQSYRGNDQTPHLQLVVEPQEVVVIQHVQKLSRHSLGWQKMAKTKRTTNLCESRRQASMGSIGIEKG
jgi:hypothetical protein